MQLQTHQAMLPHIGGLRCNPCSFSPTMSQLSHPVVSPANGRYFTGRFLVARASSYQSYEFGRPFLCVMFTAGGSGLVRRKTHNG